MQICIGFLDRIDLSAVGISCHMNKADGKTSKEEGLDHTIKLNYFWGNTFTAPEPDISLAPWNDLPTERNET